jgi:hypothetical protein
MEHFEHLGDTTIPVSPVGNDKEAIPNLLNPSNVVKDSIVAEKPILKSNLLYQLVINAQKILVQDIEQEELQKGFLIVLDLW